MIADCGEIPADEDIFAMNDDGTGDVYSDYPEESNIDFSNVCITHHLNYNSLSTKFCRLVRQNHCNRFNFVGMFKKFVIENIYVERSICAFLVQ